MRTLQRTVNAHKNKRGFKKKEKKSFVDCHHPATRFGHFDGFEETIPFFEPCENNGHSSDVFRWVSKLLICDRNWEPFSLLQITRPHTLYIHYSHTVFGLCFKNTRFLPTKPLIFVAVSILYIYINIYIIFRVIPTFLPMAPDISWWKKNSFSFPFDIC